MSLTVFNDNGDDKKDVEVAAEAEDDTEWASGDEMEVDEITPTISTLQTHLVITFLEACQRQLKGLLLVAVDDAIQRASERPIPINCAFLIMHFLLYALLYFFIRTVVSDYLDGMERTMCVINNIVSSLPLVTFDNLLNELNAAGYNLISLAQTCLRISLTILEQIVLKEKSSSTSSTGIFIFI